MYLEFLIAICTFVLFVRMYVTNKEKNIYIHIPLIRCPSFCSSHPPVFKLYEININGHRDWIPKRQLSQWFQMEKICQRQTQAFVGWFQKESRTWKWIRTQQAMQNNLQVEKFIEKNLLNFLRHCLVLLFANVSA